MRIEELNWMDVENYLKKDDRIIIVLGACEQHGYLSLLSDVKIPQALGDAASQKTGVLVAPAMNFGSSPYFLTYPGTISLRISTLLDVVEDVIRSVYGYGFRRILILNGHGGNQPASGRICEVLNQLPGLKVTWYSWWISHSVELIAQKYQIKPYHASWLEDFPFTRVCDLPGGTKIPPHYVGMLGATEEREVMGDGVFGGPYQVDQAIMDEIFAACLEDILFHLKFE